MRASSDTRLHRHTSLLLEYPSEKHIFPRANIDDRSFQSSINDNHQRFSTDTLIDTHFPIATIQQGKSIWTSPLSSQLPTVPKQTGTFIHRLVNKFLFITNPKQNRTPIKRIQREGLNTILQTRNISDDSQTILNLPTKRKRRRPHSKMTKNKNKHCTICRKYRNYFSHLPIDAIQSSRIVNTNAITTSPDQIISSVHASRSIMESSLEKVRTLNKSQCQTIVSAVELIFDTLISNYQ